MENVPQVHGDKNWDSWRAWIDFLHDKGYSSYWKDLNAKEVGYPTPVPQNRDRCFMVSILGDYDYKFPRVQNYDGCINDILEEKVDEKYFVTNEKADELISKLLADGILPDRGGRAVDMKLDNPRALNEANTITTREDRGISSMGMASTGIMYG